MSSDDQYLHECRRRIEDSLHWGDSEGWQNADFDNLSEIIFEKTGVSLSCSTLKRIWGKVNYGSRPSLTTLNALARFIGYDHWRAFVASASPKPEVATIYPTQKPIPKLSYLGISLGVLLGLGILIILIWSGKKQSRQLFFKNPAFSAKKVAGTIPNTVVFTYDATASNADSVFIQQDWDMSRRVKVDKHLHELTTTYYEPGFFKAKLILNDSVVRTNDVLIESAGWMALFKRKPEPVYFSSLEIHKQDFIGIVESDLSSKHIDLSQDQKPVLFYNVSQNIGISGEAFRMKVDMLNTYKKNNGVCQFSEVVLMGSEGVIIIPLSIKGCSGELNLFLGSDTVKGKTNDLSGFGVDFSKWVNVECSVLNREIRISIDGNLVYHSHMKNDIGSILGTCIGFLGTGQFKNFELTGIVRKDAK